MKKYLGMTIAASMLLALCGCAPEVGSERWCKQLEEQPKGEWSANDAAAFTKHCVLGIKAEE